MLATIAGTVCYLHMRLLVAAAVPLSSRWADRAESRLRRGGCAARGAPVAP